MILNRAPISPQLGFLTVINEAGGWVGSYFVTNFWGRPLEYRITSAVQPTRVQQLLYADTLIPYLHADLIGKTLVEKTVSPASLILTDVRPVLELRTRVEVPVVWVPTPVDADAARLAAAAGLGVSRPGSPTPVAYLHPKYPGDAETVRAIFEQLDGGLDLAEPFRRLRDAMQESRKMGGARGA